MRDIVDDALEDFVQEKIWLVIRHLQCHSLVKFYSQVVKDTVQYLPYLPTKQQEVKIFKVMDLALSAEIIHTATLVHDDIYDSSKTRRANPHFMRLMG